MSHEEWQNYAIFGALRSQSEQSGGSSSLLDRTKNPRFRKLERDFFEIDLPETGVTLHHVK
jgi:hypothetical protein